MTFTFHFHEKCREQGLGQSECSGTMVCRDDDTDCVAGEGSWYLGGVSSSPGGESGGCSGFNPSSVSQSHRLA